MSNRVIVEWRGKKYRVHKNAKCTKRTCDLFKTGLCDNDGDNVMPCAGVHMELVKSGLQEWYGVNFKEAK